MDGDGRKISMEHLYEIGAGESNDDVISGLGRHLAAKFKISQTTRKPLRIEKMSKYHL